MSIIKYNNKTINKLEYNTSEVNKMYYNSDVCYGGDGGDTPTPPTPSFDGKWLATYSDSHTESGECDSTSAITAYVINGNNIRNLLIGECVTGITSTYIFYNWSLIAVTIGNNVSLITDNSFGSCRSLTSVTIGSGVTRIGNSVFNGCSGLTSITIEATTPPTLGTAVFTNTNNCPIYVPSASVTAYKSASRWSSLASRIQAIPNS